MKFKWWMLPLTNHQDPPPLPKTTFLVLFLLPTVSQWVRGGRAALAIIGAYISELPSWVVWNINDCVCWCCRLIIGVTTYQHVHACICRVSQGFNEAANKKHSVVLQSSHRQQHRLCPPARGIEEWCSLVWQAGCCFQFIAVRSEWPFSICNVVLLPHQPMSNTARNKVPATASAAERHSWYACIHN